MTTHFYSSKFDRTQCGLPSEVASIGGDVDCDYCLNEVRHPEARNYEDYHRAQLAALARRTWSGLAPGDAPQGRASGPEAGTVRLAEADVATLRAWLERLKYASLSQVADFRPEELKPLVAALGRALGH